MTFSLFDLTLIVIFSQGLFLLIAVQLMPNKNREANRALSFVLGIASTMLLGRVLLYHIQNDYFFKFGIITDTMIFLFGPFLYLYIRRLTFKEKQTYSLGWIHFALALVYFSFFVVSLFINNEKFLSFYSSKDSQILFFFVEMLGLISISFYTVKSYFLLQIFKRNQKSHLSYDQYISKYLKSLLLALTCFVFLWTFSFVSNYFLGVYYRLISYDAMWISSSLLMYFVGFYSLTQPQILRVPIQINSKQESVKNRLKPEEIDSLKKSIQLALEKDKVYLQSDLSLTNFAEILNTTSNNLSWLLNKVYHKSFYEFINEYRVYDFIQRIQKNEHKQLTIFSIALEVGFNSKSTFNKAFKSITKETPSNYIRRIEV